MLSQFPECNSRQDALILQHNGVPKNQTLPASPMHYLVFMIVLLFTPSTQAAVARCGTDAFGNDICMDGHGVVSSPPKGQTKNRAGEQGSSASAVTAGAAGKQSGRDDAERGVRCGTDPFGNTVCANVSTPPKE